MKNRIKELRKLRKMTQQELAQKIGTSQVQIGRLENSERGLNIEDLPIIAKALDCEPWELLPLDMQPKITPEEQELLKVLRKVKSTNEVSSTTKAS
jgi:transcriptional regulator with XRE-family HTH domain